MNQKLKLLADRALALWRIMTARDKRLHLALGAVAAVYMWLVMWIDRHYGPQASTMLAVVGLCVGYELQQKYLRNGEASWLDALAGIAGGAAVVFALY